MNRILALMLTVLMLATASDFVVGQLDLPPLYLPKIQLTEIM